MRGVCLWRTGSSPVIRTNENTAAKRLPYFFVSFVRAAKAARTLRHRAVSRGEMTTDCKNADKSLQKLPERLIIFSEHINSDNSWILPAGGDGVETDNGTELIAELYSEMFAKLLRLARTAGYGEDDAYELVQDTFCVAVQNAERLLASGNREGWLVNTLKNLIKNDRRSRAKAPMILPAVDDRFDPDGGGIVPASTDDYGFELDDLLSRAVGEKDYALFKDVRVYKLSDEELEAKYGTKAANCRNRAVRIKKKLLKALKNFS